MCLCDQDGFNKEITTGALKGPACSETGPVLDKPGLKWQLNTSKQKPFNPDLTDPFYYVNWLLLVSYRCSYFWACHFKCSPAGSRPLNDKFQRLYCTRACLRRSKEKKKEEKKKKSPTPLKISCLMKSAYRAKLQPACWLYSAASPRRERLVLGRTTETNQDRNPDVRAAWLNSWEKEGSAALFHMERRGLAVFWCGTILFGSVLLRQAGEFRVRLRTKRSRVPGAVKATRVTLLLPGEKESLPGTALR